MSKSTTPNGVRRLVAAREFAVLSEILRDVGAATGSGLWGSGVASVVAGLQANLHRPTLLICGHLDEADDLADDIELFAGRRPDVLPALEMGGTLGRLSEEQVSNRMRLIARMAGGGSGFGFRVSGVGEEAEKQDLSSRNPKPETRNPIPPACFNCVIPLSFIPEGSELGNLPGPTGLTDLKTLAIARLMLDNIAHIKAFWIMQGVGLSQVALDWGCDDLDGTVVWYDITKRREGGVGGGGGTTHQELHETDIRRLIREAGRVPVERDTLYREVRREPASGRVVRDEPVLAG